VYQLAFQPVVAGYIQMRIIQVSGHRRAAENIRHIAFDRPFHISVKKHNVGDNAPVDAAAFADNNDIRLHFAQNIAVNLDGMVGFYVAVKFATRPDDCRALLVCRIGECEHFFTPSLL
jgi:hypothetical protein